MEKKYYRVESKKIENLPVVRVEGSNSGKFQKLEHFIVKDEAGNILLETKEFKKSQDTTYFLRESSKKDAYLLGVCEIASGLCASGYKKNEYLGNGWYRMSAYGYKWEGNTLIRTTVDSGAAYERIDNGTPVARRNGNVITMLKKTPTSKLAKSVNNPSAQRTDANKVHHTDNSARSALEKVRRDNKRK